VVNLVFFVTLLGDIQVLLWSATSSASAAAASRFFCPERNFVIIGSNDSKHGMHASGNDSEVHCTRTVIYLVPF